MAQVVPQISRAGVTFLAALMGFLVACAPIAAKCPLLFIEIEGEILGIVPGDSRLEVDVSPDPNAVQETIPIEDGNFAGRIKFDTTKSGGRFHHDCSRRPVTVRIEFVRRSEVSQVLLRIADDFVVDEEGDYYLKESVVLDSDRDPKENSDPMARVEQSPLIAAHSTDANNICTPAFFELKEPVAVLIGASELSFRLLAIGCHEVLEGIWPPPKEALEREFLPELLEPHSVQILMMIRDRSPDLRKRLVERLNDVFEQRVVYDVFLFDAKAAEY